MRGLLVILLVAIFCIPAYAAGTYQLKAANTFIATHDVPDSAGEAYTPADSVQVTVTFQDGTEALAASWFNNADAQAALVNGNLYFFDAWDDMNGTDGVGSYTVLLRWYDGSGAALDFEETYIVQQTTMGLEDISDSLQAIIDSLQNHDDWIATAANLTLAIDSVNAILDSIQAVVGVNAIQLSGDAAAANNLEAMLDGTGADIKVDSAAFDVVTIINSTADPGLTIKSATGDAVYFQSSGGSGKAALYLDADGTNGIGLRAEGITDGIKAVGSTLDLNLTLNLGDVAGQLGATAFADSFITEPKLKGKLFIAQKFNTDAFTADVFAPDAFDGEDFTDAYWDSVAARSDSGSVGSGVWGEAEKDSVLAALFDYGSAVSGGSIPFLTRMFIGFPGASPGWDSLTNSVTGMIGTYSGGGGDDNNIKDDIDALSAASGSGPRLCSLFVSDANDDAITDGSTRMTSGATTYTADVSGDGFAVYSLTDATWQGLVYATGFVQDTIPQTFTVSASMKDTLTMTVVSIGEPSGADKVICSIDTYDIMGALVQNAKLTATVSDNGPWFAVDDSSAIMIPTTISAKTNSSGRATIELWESAEVRDEAGKNPTFNFTLGKSNHLLWEVKDRTTPDADNWQIK